MKKIMALALAVAVMFTFAACGPTNNNTDDEGHSAVIENGIIKIGMITPLTGAVAVYGTSAYNAVKLAISEINASEDILPGYTIELTQIDDQGDATVGTGAFSTLLSSGISALIGPITTGVTAAVTSLANENEIVMITPTATGDNITTASDYVFRSCFKDSSQGVIAAQYAAQLGYERVAILYAQGDAYSTGLRNAFVEECENLGIEVAIEMTSPTISDETTFASQISTIVGEIGEDGFLFAPYYYDAVGPLIIPDARNSGFKGVIMGSDGYDGMVPDYVSGDLSVYNKVYFTNHYSAESEDEKVVNFINGYVGMYNETPTAFSALGYDATYMLATALEEVLKTTPDSVSGKDLKAAMDGMSYSGVTGNMTLDETGTPEKSAVIIEYSYNEETGKVESHFVGTIG